MHFLIDFSVNFKMFNFNFVNIQNFEQHVKVNLYYLLNALKSH